VRTTRIGSVEPAWWAGRISFINSLVTEGGTFSAIIGFQTATAGNMSENTLAHGATRSSSTPSPRSSATSLAIHPPYKHWHAVCAACGKVTLARPCRIPGEIEPLEHNPVIKCQHCEDTRQYLTKECFLAPLSVAAVDKSAGALAVVAGLLAAVKLARVESTEIQNRSPRVRPIISESITIARMVVEASKAKL